MWTIILSKLGRGGFEVLHPWEKMQLKVQSFASAEVALFNNNFSRSTYTTPYNFRFAEYQKF